MTVSDVRSMGTGATIVLCRNSAIIRAFLPSTILSFDSKSIEEFERFFDFFEEVACLPDEAGFLGEVSAVF
jgi:hypothetical protein